MSSPMPEGVAQVRSMRSLSVVVRAVNILRHYTEMDDVDLNNYENGINYFEIKDKVMRILRRCLQRGTLPSGSDQYHLTPSPMSVDPNYVCKCCRRQQRLSQSPKRAESRSRSRSPVRRYNYATSASDRNEAAGDAGSPDLRRVDGPKNFGASFRMHWQ